ncbi:MAG: carboxypeptidase regulatory-like domain-containing protein, partial [Kiritimatiellae bacterium]|nr:carboxypeptidase regulatory-like domain-containing protein [Kiritimatiellia bacterium]
YDDFTDPAWPGAGGGDGWTAGGVGGGLVRITAAGATIDGVIRANGEAGAPSGDSAGAGGGVRLDVGALSGTGLISADGGAGYGSGGSGGGGRIAIAYDDISGFSVSNITAKGGSGGTGSAALGTVYLKDNAGSAQLLLDSYGTATGRWTPLGLASNPVFAVDHLLLSGAGVVAAPEHEMALEADSVAILGGAILTHRPTTNSTEYSLTMTVAGQLAIDADSGVDVSCRGYLRHYTAGNTTNDATTGSAGGSHGGLGHGLTANWVYDDFANPASPGAGAGTDWTDGGVGGGLVHLTVAGTATVDGVILANGESGYAWGDSAGSGGGIRLDVGVLTGTGRISANGGNGYGGGGSGGGGRSAVYFADMSGFSRSNVTATGGTGGTGNGAVGTVYFKGSDGTDELRIDSYGAMTGTWTPLGLATNPALVATDLVIAGTNVVVAPEHQMPMDVSNLFVRTGAMLTHQPTTNSQEYALQITVRSNLVVESSAKIDASRRGYLRGYTRGNSTSGGATGPAGGSYGGLGHGLYANKTYGDYANPLYPGAGAGTDWAAGGVGGGLIRIAAGTALVDGDILANGEQGASWGDSAGAGGGILLDVGTLSGAGRIAAAGGNGYGSGGSGGGGRVAVVYDDISGFTLSNITAIAGVGGGGQAAVGTVWLRNRHGSGELRLHSYGSSTGIWTPLGAAGDTVFNVDNLSIAGAGVVAAPAGAFRVAAGNVTLADGAVLTHPPTTNDRLYSLDLAVGSNLTVDAASRIDVSRRGYLRGYTKGNTTVDGATGTAGGSYGGRGAGTTSNKTYGDAAFPFYCGSGAGTAWTEGGSGGGLATIMASTLALDGAISANGENGASWGDSAGSGGGILLNVKVLSGAGTVSAAGGNGYGSGGSGGGGRVAVYASGTLSLPTTNMTAAGGTGGGGSGEDGTVYIGTNLALAFPGPRHAFLSGTADLPYIVLGGGSGSYTVSATAYQATTPYAVGTRSDWNGTIAWDTTEVPDGRYQLTGAVHDGVSNLLASAVAEELVTVNNSVTLLSGTVSTNTMLGSNGVYVVNGVLEVCNGATLTIEGGAILKFSAGGRIHVRAGGTLDTTATVDAPAVLTALEDDSAGGDTNLDGSNTVPLPGSWHGVSSETGATLALNAYVEFRYVRTAHSGPVSADTTWSGYFLHAIEGDVSVAAGVTLTLEPGAIVKFADKKGIALASGARLLAVGTVAEPIIFTSDKDDTAGGDTNDDGTDTAPAAGDWRWLYFDSATGALEHVELRYGGGTASGNWDSTGVIRMAGSSAVTLRNSTLRQIFFDGVLAWGGPILIENGVLTGIDRAVCAHPGSPVQVVNCTLDDNRIGLLVHGGTLDVTNTIVVGSYESGIQYDFGTLSTVGYCNVWNTNSTALNYRNTTDRTGQDGNVSADPQFKNVAGGDYRLQYLSPMIDAADTTAAPAEDFMGAPRYDDPRTANTGVAGLGGEVADMGAFEFVETADSPIDLIVAEVAGPTTATAGEQVTVSWTIRNAGSTAITGAWHDLILLCPDTPGEWDEPHEAAEALTEATLGAGQSATFEGSVRVPGGTEGAWRWQVKVNCRGEVFEGTNWNNNTSLPSLPTELQVPALTLGVAADTTFAAEGEPSWYKVVQPAGTELGVVLDAAATSGRCRLYAGYEQMPTEQNFDVRSTDWNTPDARLALAAPVQERTCYLMLVPESLGGGALGYTLTAQAASFALDSIGLAQAGNAGQATIPLFGSQFESGMQAALRPSAGGADIGAGSVAVPDSTAALATFDLDSAIVGQYSVLVDKAGDERVLTNAFTISAGTGGILQARLVMPQAARMGRPFKGVVEYANIGDGDLAAPILIVQGGANNPVWAQGASQGTETLLQLLALPPQGPCAGVLRPGEQYSVTFNTVSYGSNARYTLLSKAADSTDLLDWNAMKSQVKPADADAIWDDAWAAIVQAAGDSYAGYIAALTQAAVEARGYGQDLIVVRDILIYMVKRETFRLPGAHISGTLYLNATNRPLARTTVCAYRSGATESNALTAVSWYDGTFAIRDVPPDTYDLSAPGYLPEPWGTVTFAGQPVTNQAVVVYEGAQLGGQIVAAANGAVITGATVLVADTLSERGYSGLTDADGYYAVKGIDSGKYDVSILADSFAPYRVYGLNIATGEVKSLSAALEAGGGMSGQVLDTNGVGYAGATVAVYSDAGDCVKQTTSGADGAFSLSGLATGSYQLVVSAQDFGAGTSTGIEVADRAVTQGVSASLTVSGRLFGTVTNALSGVPISGVIVRSDAPGAERRDPIATDAAGQFTVPDLPAGQQSVWFLADGYLPAERTVSVTAGQQTDASAGLYVPGRIQGTVRRNSDHSPVSDIAVNLIQEGGPVNVVETDAGGGFSFTDLIYTNYILAVRAGVGMGAYVYREARVLTPESSPLARTIDLALARLEGTVYQAGGATPSTNAPVYLALDGQLVGYTYTGTDGAFAFRLFQAGTAELMAAAPDVGYVRQTGIAVTLGQDATGQNLVATDQADLHILASAADTVEDALVWLSPADTNVCHGILMTATADASGYAVIRDLPPGDYRLEIWARELCPFQDTISIGTTNATISAWMDAGRTVEGTVRDESGVSIAGATLTFTDTATTMVFRAASDADGNYAVSMLPPAEYSVLAVDGLHQPERLSGVSTFGELSRTLDVTLDSYLAGAATGTVTDGAGNPVFGASVTATDSALVPLGTALTGPDGQYVLGGLPVERVLLAAQGYTEDGLMFQTLTPSAGVTSTVDFALGNAVASAVRPAGSGGGGAGPGGAATGGAPTPGAPDPVAPQMNGGSYGSYYSHPATYCPSGYNLDVMPPPGTQFQQYGPPNYGTVPVQKPSGFRLPSWCRSGKVPPPARLTKDTDAWRGSYLKTWNSDRYDCSGWVSAWDRAHRTRCALESAWDGWNLSYKQMQQIGFANTGLATTKGLLVGAKAWLALASLFNGSGAGAAIEQAGLAGHAAIWAEAGIDIVISATETIANRLAEGKWGEAQEIRDSIIGPILSGSYEEIVQQIANNDTAIMKYIDPDNAAKMAEAYGAGFKMPMKILGALGPITDFMKFYDEQQKLFEESFDAHKGYEQGQDLYSQALGEYDRALADLKNKITESNNQPENSDLPDDPEEEDDDDVPTSTSHDPNDKLTVGVGPQGYIAPDALLFYTIRFENVSNATASAQQVVVTDQLPPELDWSTVELGDVGFNNTDVSVGAGLSRFETSASVATDPNPVQATGALDPDTGLLTWIIRSVDPVTGDLPEDPLAGFLPPNTNPPCGEGYVTFSARMATNVTAGTLVTNWARIVFDYNPPIDTPVVTNTVDTGSPSSAVTGLPGVVPLRFNVAWSGQDEPGGSGIAAYDIYVSTNNAAYTAWLRHTTSAGAAFTGQAGVTYRFYSVAIDGTGQREAPPSAADAVTRAGVSYHDFDGDGRTDLGLYHAAGGTWYLLQSGAGFAARQFGWDGPIPVPADYDGDGKTDLALYYPTNGGWYILRTRDGFRTLEFGWIQATAVPGDYDGDGSADIAVYGWEGNWYVLASQAGFSVRAFGYAGPLLPVPGDYDGDGKTDLGLYHEFLGEWYLLRTTAGFTARQFGWFGPIPVPADYDGDGKADLAVYFGGNGTWYLMMSTDGFAARAFGWPGPIPAPGDYDGDGKTDLALYYPPNGTWYIMQSTAGFKTVQFGWSAPVPTAGKW